MVCPRRLFFSQFVVLMCTANCEKDSLLGQTILALEPFLFFENPCFLLVIYTNDNTLATIEATTIIAMITMATHVLHYHSSFALGDRLECSDIDTISIMF